MPIAYTRPSPTTGSPRIAEKSARLPPPTVAASVSVHATPPLSARSAASSPEPKPATTSPLA